MGQGLFRQGVQGCSRVHVRFQVEAYVGLRGVRTAFQTYLGPLHTVQLARVACQYGFQGPSPQQCALAVARVDAYLREPAPAEDRGQPPQGQQHHECQCGDDRGPPPALAVPAGALRVAQQDVLLAVVDPPGGRVQAEADGEYRAADDEQYQPHQADQYAVDGPEHRLSPSSWSSAPRAPTARGAGPGPVA